MKYHNKNKSLAGDQLIRCKQHIAHHLAKTYKYNMEQTINEIRPSYYFRETCQETVPQAIIAFLESVDFEDAIRNAISIGGDSDTLAAITGSVAEAAYGVPPEIAEKAHSYLDDQLKDVLKKWNRFVRNADVKY